MKLVFISDTHNKHNWVELPEGDVLIHSGDATIGGTRDEVERFADWFSSRDFKRKIFIAGNHDWLFQRQPELGKALLGSGVDYLKDSSIDIGGVRFYGSPWQPRFFDWAFNLPRGEMLERKWKMIPSKVDVLITHGPPAGVLDRLPSGEIVGCDRLWERVLEVGPKIHAFGHIHCAYGRVQLGETLFINSSICDEAYRVRNRAVEVEI